MISLSPTLPGYFIDLEYGGHNFTQAGLKPGQAYVLRRYGDYISASPTIIAAQANAMIHRNSLFPNENFVPISPSHLNLNILNQFTHVKPGKNLLFSNDFDDINDITIPYHQIRNYDDLREQLINDAALAIATWNSLPNSYDSNLIKQFTHLLPGDTEAETIYVDDDTHTLYINDTPLWLIQKDSASHLNNQYGNITTVSENSDDINLACDFLTFVAMAIYTGNISPETRYM